MAATNFTPIQLYFSTTASAVPLAANLAQGELAINITDGKLYYEDNAGAVQVIATKGAGTIGGSTTQIQYNNAGALAGNAAMVFNNSTNVTTLTTLNLTNALGAIYGGTAQSTYAQGDFLYASATNTLSKLGIGANTYILTSTGSVPQWVAPSSIAVLTATNLAGGLAGSVPYQSALDTTTFLAIGAANRVMTSTGTAPQWVTSLTGLTGVSSSSITNTSLTSGRVVVSSTAGLQADDADLTFDGTTLSAGGFSTVGLSTLVKTVKIGDSSFNGVAVFAAATPAKLYMGTGTVTDVTSAISATNAIGAIASLGITPIAATNTSVTYTNAATLYIAGAPSAGTNVTLTNPYALYVAAGDAYFGGTVTAGTVNLTTLDLTNLEVTNIKAKDGTAAMTIADSTGVVSFTANPILSGGTANGVLYLNGSKVVTSGSALVFDGTNLSVGTTALSGGKFSTIADLALVQGLVIRDSATTYANNNNFVLLQNSAGATVGGLTHPAVTSLGVWGNTDIRFLVTTGATLAMTLDSTGLGIGSATSLSTKGKLGVYGTGDQTDESTATATFGSWDSGGMRTYFGVNNTNSYTYIGSVKSATSYGNLVLQPNGGNLLVGTTSATASPSSYSLSGSQTHIYGALSANSNSTAFSDQKTTLWIDNSSASTNNEYAKSALLISSYEGAGSNPGPMARFYRQVFPSAPARVFEVNNLGNIGLGDTNASTTGTGITFPATQSASSDANTLDDYEEGTWTPSLGGTATYSQQSGRYTKVGRIVTISFDIAIGTLGTGSVGSISGLPFTQGSGVVRSGITVAYYNALAVSVIYIVGVVDGATSNIFFSSSAASSASITDAVSPFGNGARIIGSGTYITAT